MPIQRQDFRNLPEPEPYYCLPTVYSCARAAPRDPPSPGHTIFEMAKLPVRKKAKKAGGHGGSTGKPRPPKVQPKKNLKKINITKSQSPAAPSKKPVKKVAPPKAPGGEPGKEGAEKPKMHKRTKRGGIRGRGGRRVTKKIKAKKIVMEKRYKSGTEKDDKLMKKFAKVQETPTAKKDINVDPKELIDLEMLRAAISGLRKLPSAGKSERKSLHDITDEDGRLVYLQLTLCKLPKVHEDMHMSGPTTVNVHLPHSLVTDNTDVILITKDLQRGVRRDHQNSLDHFKELLHTKGVASLVNEIIPLRQLKVEYKEFEAKRLLANRTDVLLCDDTVVRFIPKFLSKHFYTKKRLPVQVNLKAQNLEKELLRALSVSRLFFSLKGNSSIMKVGRMGQSDEEIEKNVLEAVRKLATHVPGEWNNIQGLSLKLESTQSIPLYVRMESLNSVKPLPAKRVFHGEPVSGTLTTVPGRCITVFPDGSITSTWLKKNKNRIAKEDEDLAKKDDQEPDSTAGKKGKKAKKAKSATPENGLEGTETAETEETGITEAEGKTKETTKKRKTTIEEKKTSKAKKQKKARDSDSDSDSGEDDLEEQELMYLKQLSRKGEEPAKEDEEEAADEDSEVDVWGESESDMDESD